MINRKEHYGFEIVKNKGTRIREMLEDGKSYGEITRALEVAASTVAYHAKVLGRQKFTFTRKNYDWAAVQEMYDSGHTMSDIVNHFGMNPSTIDDAKKTGRLLTVDGTSPERRKKVRKKRTELIKEVKKTGNFGKRGLIFEKVFCVDSYHSTGVVRKLLRRNNMLPYCCSNEKCPLHPTPNPMWCGEPIILHLDHVNYHAG